MLESYCTTVLSVQISLFTTVLYKMEFSKMDGHVHNGPTPFYNSPTDDETAPLPIVSDISTRG